MSDSARITFIGGGNMAQSLIGGLLDAGFPPEELAVADPDPEQRRRLTRHAGLHIARTAAELLPGARLIVLAVKPQIAPGVLAELGPRLGRTPPVLLSIVAGLRLDTIERHAGCRRLPVIRAMPNTPAMVRRGISAFYANPRVAADGKSLARRILQAVGETIELENESDLDIVTAVSGSGPAYFFLLTEAIETAATASGLAPAIALKLARETGIGAMALLSHSKATPGELRAQVTSPGGTTAAAIEEFKRGDFTSLVQRAVTRATDRARELGIAMENDE